jgi:hypothetical protein
VAGSALAAYEFRRWQSAPFPPPAFTGRGAKTQAPNETITGTATTSGGDATMAVSVDTHIPDWVLGV